MKKILLLLLAVLFTYLIHAQITSTATGNWNNPATWAGGVVPSASDAVIIASPHIVTVNITNAACSDLTINSGGRLDINTVTMTLTVGNFNSGGGNALVEVYGNVTISNGALNIGGRLKHYSVAGNSWSQTGGFVRIDGNTGSVGSSVSDADYLMDINVIPSGSPVVNFNATGGTLQFIDPPFGASGRLLNSRGTNIGFGAAHHVRFGDGISTTAGGNANGFINNTFSVAGDIIVNNPSGLNRSVTNLRNTTCNDINIIAGDYTYSGLNITANGDVTNQGSMSSLTSNSLTAQGTISNLGTMNIYQLIAQDNLSNTGSSSISVTNLYFRKNLLNNSTLTATNLFSASSGASSSTFPQLISGNGTYNLSSALFTISNASASGVTLGCDLTVERINNAAGKVKMDIYNVTFNTLPVNGGGSTAYFETNSTGRLRFVGLGASEVLFNVGTGTSYNPVLISNGGGAMFTVGVKDGFTSAPPGTQHVNKEWNISEIVGGRAPIEAANATVTLQWNTADEDITFNRSNCALAHYDGTSWDALSASGTASNPLAGIYRRQATGVQSFSPFTITSNPIVLPLNLLSFNAFAENNKVKLAWKTSQEINVSHFEIQRSYDGVNYHTIATQQAKNAITENFYSVYDNSPAKGKNFYRLQMIDKDGRFTNSLISRVDFDSPWKIIIAPNPVTSMLTVYGLYGSGQLLLIDMSGKTVLKKTIQQGMEQIEMRNLQDGLYLLQINVDNKVTSMKVQKIKS
jgi:hypothetical protein